MPDVEINLEDFEEIINPKLDHLAICHKVQGYSANGWGDKPLMLKAAEGNTEVLKQLRKSLRQVRVEMSMEEFLRKFFHLYYDDATLLARVLGYETEADAWAEDYADEKAPMITLLKSIKTEEDFLNLEYEVQDKIISLQSKFEKSLLSGIPSECTDADLTKSNNNVVNSDTNHEENDKNMPTDVDNQKVETLEKKLQDAEALIKAANDKAEAAEKRANEVLEKNKTDVLMAKAKDYDLIDNKEDFVSLMKSADDKITEAVFSLLAKSKEKIDELQKKVEEIDVMTKQMSAAVDVSFSAAEGEESYDQRLMKKLQKKHSQEGDK